LNYFNGGSRLSRELQAVICKLTALTPLHVTDNRVRLLHESISSRTSLTTLRLG